VAVNGLPEDLAYEVEELGRFAIRHSAVADQLILSAEVRGVPIVMHLDVDTYPREPPTIEVSPDWDWGRHDGKILGLSSQERWNRTLGIGTLLRELEQQFIEEPPRKRRKRRGAGGIRQRVVRFFGWLKRLLRRRPSVRSARARVKTGAMPEAIRARYQEIIRDKSSRIDRYKQAVSQIMAQGQHRVNTFEKLAGEMQQLEQSQARRMVEAERRVDSLKAAGKSVEEIHGDVEVRNCRQAYEADSVTLEEMRERFDELEEDVEQHREKLTDHAAQIEALESELQETRDEFAEVADDLTTVQLEQEIVDLQTGITRSEAERELEDLLRQFRKAKASVRITKEAAELDRDNQDSEYLDVARRVSAAEKFEKSVGLGAPESRGQETVEDPRERG